MKKYFFIVTLLLLSLNNNSLAQELKNCIFGKSSLNFIIDRENNTVTQINPQKGTERIFNIKEIKDDFIITEVRPDQNQPSDGTELNLDLKLAKVEAKRVQDQGGGFNVYYDSYLGQCQNQNSSNQANSSSTNAINLFGLNATMNMVTAEQTLGNNGYKCLPLNQFEKLCINGEKKIKLSSDLFVFTCSAFNGCAYKADEVRNFFQKELSIQINSRELSTGLIQTEAICGEGPAGDKICVVNESITSDVGPSIYLMKHKLGSTGMSLN